MNSDDTNAVEQECDEDQTVLWLRIREHNSWEGETWYQALAKYFSPGLLLKLSPIRTTESTCVPTGSAS